MTTPQEAFNEGIENLIQSIEDRYKDLLQSIPMKDNALARFIFLTDSIEIADRMPSVEGLWKETLLNRLYLLRSEIAVEAEFIKIMYEK